MSIIAEFLEWTLLGHSVSAFSVNFCACVHKGDGAVVFWFCITITRWWCRALGADCLAWAVTTTPPPPTDGRPGLALFLLAASPVRWDHVQYWAHGSALRVAGGEVWEALRRADTWHSFKCQKRLCCLLKMKCRSFCIFYSPELYKEFAYWLQPCTGGIKYVCQGLEVMRTPEVGREDLNRKCF